ncbi:PPPDE putative peptidase domain-containing protein [Cokeromyces recurvatus]|uniref:PPPDE putative peptidase domain-containing protein n=1 Tax=Cokeromyces recurvatus TaxID=90255 RepID=UPI00221F0AC9|nr:PPPDE putative peptidase domain-containing protein [Cokeromyces recurvatus]KAI7899709.1 PPPDE putative peptidase domain-containing protein [Cokeromyces recurvatus]
MFDLVRNTLHKTETNTNEDKLKVFLNVYDMLQPSFITKLGHVLGIGIYHSGIEIGEHEYCFGGHDYEKVTGVFIVRPKSGLQGLLFKQSINMGYTNLTRQQVDKILKDISKEYSGTSYKLLTRNCNHFSEDLCKRLTGKTAPGWINRAAKLGTMFPCVIPTEWIEPPDANGNGILL